MIIETGGKMMPVEIKSGQTVSPDFFTGLQKWLKLSGSDKGWLVYGGRQPQTRQNVEVVPWQLLPRSIEI